MRKFSANFPINKIKRLESKIAFRLIKLKGLRAKLLKVLSCHNPPMHITVLVHFGKPCELSIYIIQVQILHLTRYDAFGGKGG